MTEKKPDCAAVDVVGLTDTSDKVVKESDQISIKLKIDICHLKTQTQIFKQFEIRLEDDTLNFLRPNKASNKSENKYTNTLKGVHVTPDARTAECP